jgi:hypothetical protein
MITKDKLKELTRRMYDHCSVNETALCILTASELQDLLVYAAHYFNYIQDKFGDQDLVDVEVIKGTK